MNLYYIEGLGIIQMNILAEAIVSNSDNQPDAVLFSITEYERLSVFIEYLESLEGKDIAKITESLPMEGNRKRYSIDHLRNDIK